jgi:hypothetical protein
MIGDIIELIIELFIFFIPDGKKKDEATEHFKNIK